jgi:hypothetical protein
LLTSSVLVVTTVNVPGVVDENVAELPEGVNVPPIGVLLQVTAAEQVALAVTVAANAVVVPATIEL